MVCEYFEEMVPEDIGVQGEAKMLVHEDFEKAAFPRVTVSEKEQRCWVFLI